MSRSPLDSVIFLQMGCDLGNQNLQLLFSFHHLGSLLGHLKELVEDLLELPNPFIVELGETLGDGVLHK